MVVPVFCFERGLHSGRHASPNRNAYLLASLRELDEQLQAAGSRHALRSPATPAVQIPRLAEWCGAAPVHVNRDHTVHARARDRRGPGGARRARHRARRPHRHQLRRDRRDRDRLRRPVPGLHPVLRAWSRAGGARSSRTGRARSSSPDGVAGRPAAEREGPRHRRAARSGSPRPSAPGEEAGRQPHARRRSRRADDYHRVRDLAGADATTRLSPHLHFGTVSARELELGLLDRRDEGRRRSCAASSPGATSGST